MHCREHTWRQRWPAAIRPGFTMVEMIVTLVIFGIIMTAALGFLNMQLRAFAAGTERVQQAQNFRFAINVLEQNLRTVGAGTFAEQPFLIYAGTDVIAFNANYASNTPNDPFAVYSDTTAPDAEVRAVTTSRRFQLPRTTFFYPDTAYGPPGAGPAETIILFFAPDTLTERQNDFVLKRQINDTEPEVIARNLIQTGSIPFFQYIRIYKTNSTPPALALDEIAASSLPLEHSVSLHNSDADTAQFALIDSIRAIRVQFTVTNGREGEAETRSSVVRVIQMPNAGLATVNSCGDEPILDTSLAAQTVTNPSPGVLLSWDAAEDENAGEQDIVRYVIWKRSAGALDWGDPLVSISSGTANYSYLDTQVAPGDSYTYGVRAQDCSPALSDMATAGPVMIPPAP